MTRARALTIVCLGSLFIGSLFIGCSWWPPSPADRARHFIESQVAADTPSAEPAGDLAGRVALDYARALARQGAALHYRTEAPASAGDPVITVVAVVPARADGTAPPLRFRVSLTKDGAGDWRVSAWSAAE